MDLFILQCRIVARHVYDTWGKLISIKNENGATVSASHIGSLNPIRYRSYYYDTETGLYYLQARYYDPETGRFINSDNIAGNTGNSTRNLFVYCSNNPVDNVDPTGMCTSNNRKKEFYICDRHTGYYGSYNSYRDGWTYYNNGKWVHGSKKKPSLPTNEISIGGDILGLTKDFAGVSIAYDFTDSFSSYVRLPGHGGYFTRIDRYPWLGKTLTGAGRVATAISIGVTIYEVGTILANDNLTEEQKWQGTGIAVSGTLASVGVGMLTVAAINAWNPVGWGLAAVLAVSFVATVAISCAQDYGYQKVGIEW